MRIGIDFDRVIFDTDSFNDYLKEEVEGLEHVDASPYNEHENYSPEIHAELCGIEVEKIYEKVDDLDRFLLINPEELEDTEHEIILVTRGEIEFQKAKIGATSVPEKMDDVFIVEKGSKDVGGIDFLIDDQKREIEEAEIPGFEFDHEKHSLMEALEEAERHAA
jgi:hypothetical protein